MDILVAKRYAKALLELKDISIERVLEDLKVVSKAITADEKILEFINSPIVSSSAKYKAIVEPLEDKLDPKVVNLLKIMAQKGRLALVPKLVEILEKELQFRSNSFKGIVESNEDIEQDLIEKLEKKLSNYSGANISLIFKKSDIDGVKVEVEDLGLELSFSKEAVRRALFEHIKKAL
ncbi:MAG: F0F1 ATP synthase subunit delta [Epsilonproteobacteria bacterium]|nr:F0F1 ATP synthase subunit delta [Campylobacterota bacterium]